MLEDVEAIKGFMAFLGLKWVPGTTQKAELRASYRMGNSRPFNLDRTLVEFECSDRRPKVWVSEFARTSFHEWFELPHQSFEYSPGGTMLKIRNEARGSQPKYMVGIKPLA